MYMYSNYANTPVYENHFGHDVTKEADNHLYLDLISIEGLCLAVFSRLFWA